MGGAALRGIMVVGLVALPSLILPSSTWQSAELVVLATLLCGGFTFMEYYAASPSCIEFRDAAPVNRIRFSCLLLCVLLVAITLQFHTHTTPLNTLMYHGGLMLGNLLDFPLSPVRLIQKLLPPAVTTTHVNLIRSVCSVAYFISLGAIVFYALILRATQWPLHKGPFNVWVNLPLFDPTAGGDVVARLRRDARLHFLCGFTLPFLLPIFLLQASHNVIILHMLETPQLLAWVTTGWAMIPAMMVMRAITRLRVAELITQKRRSFAQAQDFQTV